MVRSGWDCSDDGCDIHAMGLPKSCLDWRLWKSPTRNLCLGTIDFTARDQFPHIYLEIHSENSGVRSDLAHFQAMDLGDHEKKLALSASWTCDQSPLFFKSVFLITGDFWDSPQSTPKIQVFFVEAWTVYINKNDKQRIPKSIWKKTSTIYYWHSLPRRPESVQILTTTPNNLLE